MHAKKKSKHVRKMKKNTVDTDLNLLVGRCCVKEKKKLKLKLKQHEKFKREIAGWRGRCPYPLLLVETENRWEVLLETEL